MVTETFTTCFLTGTEIGCPGGTRRVESFGIGDLVHTADGRTLPVRWIGRQTVVTVFADPLRNWPIRLTAGSLGEAMPIRDLLVSPDHALLVGGLLVQAAALVNGTTIVRETDMPERFVYFHVELEEHALILAEGVPAESFVDNVDRGRFDNHATYASHSEGKAPPIAELPIARIKSARQLPRGIRAKLDRLAASLVEVRLTG